MAVLAPMPSAKVRIATAVKPGERRSIRTPNRMSVHTVSSQKPPRSLRHSSLNFSWLPNSIRARRFASAWVKPLRCRSSERFWTCARSSSSVSFSTRARRKREEAIERSRERSFMFSPREARDLFIPQRHHGIDTRRPPGGHIASQKRNEDEKRGNGGKGQGIVRRYAKQQAAHQAGRRKSCTHADYHADERHFRTLSQHHLQHVLTLRPQRQTNSYFALALRHRVRNHAIDADEPQYQRHCAGDPQHH